MESHPDDHPFSLCLTHDVDRVYQTFQAPYDALRTRSIEPIRSMRADERPYWQFETVMALEESLGVRSSWYVLQEKRLFDALAPHRWLDPRAWVRFFGRYDLGDPEIAEALCDLDRGGWEVGLHGSYESGEDLDRLRSESDRLEAVLGHPVRGGRQHYLRAAIPETWHHYRTLGLGYDASLGSRTTVGFGGLYDVVRPFDDDFLVFPLSVMDTVLFGAARSTSAAWQTCRQLLGEARANGAVMTVCWHPRHFNEDRFPGFRSVYERLVRKALAMGAWVGPCGRWRDHVVDRPAPRVTRPPAA